MVAKTGPLTGPMSVGMDAFVKGNVSRGPTTIAGTASLADGRYHHRQRILWLPGPYTELCTRVTSIARSKPEFTATSPYWAPVAA